MKKIDELKAEIKKAEKELKQKKEALEKLEKWGCVETGEYVNVKLDSVEFIGRFEGIYNGKPKIHSFGAYIGEIIGLVKKWQPKKGDLCIFWDNDVSKSIIAMFLYSDMKPYYYSNQEHYQNCIPFISEKQFKEHIGYEEC